MTAAVSVYERSQQIHAHKVATNTHFGWMGLNPAIVSCDQCLSEAEKEAAAS